MDRSCGAGGSGGPDELDDLLEEFAGYLRGERSLAATTVENYLNQVRPFLSWYSQRRQIPLAEGLTARDVNGFLAWRSGRCSAGSLTVATTALRAWLRWMFLDGRLDRQLADGIGPVRYPALAGVPKALPAADVASILALEMSARDRALVLVLARLGLRSREAAGLLLDDVDWRAGTIRVTGKGDDRQLMPLSAEVGEAQPLEEIFASRVAPGDRLRWAWAAVAGRLERLSPFWTVYSLTLTETVGATILALPIALASIGPLPGVAMLVVLGLVNVGRSRVWPRP